MALRLPRLRINKLWLLLIGAVLLGLLATWLAVTYLKSREQRMAAELAQRSKGGATVAVVVPTRDVPKGTPIDPSIVAARGIPADLLYEETITADQFDKIVGKRLLRAVQRGRPLRRGDVVDDRSRDFSDVIEPGMRALTIEIDELNSFAGMLKPGNLVDLMLIATELPMPGATPAISGQEVLDVMQKVRVLATGQTLQSASPDPLAQPQGPQDPVARRIAYANVTVEVTLEQAGRIALAMQSGKVRTALRNTEDKAQVALGLINTASLYDIGGPKARARAIQAQTQAQASAQIRVQSRVAPDGGPYVEYIVGGKGGSGAAAPINITMPPLPPGASIPGVTSDASGQAAGAQASAYANPGSNPAFSSLPPSITSGIPSVPTGSAPPRQ